jgi:hypothetical protein
VKNLLFRKLIDYKVLVIIDKARNTHAAKNQILRSLRSLRMTGGGLSQRSQLEKRIVADLHKSN